MYVEDTHLKHLSKALLMSMHNIGLRKIGKKKCLICSYDPGACSRETVKAPVRQEIYIFLFLYFVLQN